ncbi:MAG: GNAT family N-acetyltransferase [Acidimicrobiales bacterium]|nr:GNAT family N-acetyltransferase [Acidimicrobiales bacterium]
MAEPTVVDVPEQSRFEVQVDGAVAGFADYRREDERVVITHTEVDDAFEGQGLAGALTSGALDAIREREELVVPVCRFTARYIERHDEYADLVDHDRLAELADD